MEFNRVMKWIDGFEEAVVDGGKKIRGWTFSGVNVQLFPDGGVSIVLTPAVRGVTPEERAVDMAMGMLAERSEELFCDLGADRFVKVVAGEETLTDADWTWSDED